MLFLMGFLRADIPFARRCSDCAPVANGAWNPCLPGVHSPPLTWHQLFKSLPQGNAKRCRNVIGDGSVVKLLDEHERTLAFAEVAMGQIKSLRQTAVPRNYEIWYVYATGYNAPLNKIINETLRATAGSAKPISSRSTKPTSRTSRPPTASTRSAHA